MPLLGIAPITTMERCVVYCLWLIVRADYIRPLPLALSPCCPDLRNSSSCVYRDIFWHLIWIIWISFDYHLTMNWPIIQSIIWWLVDSVGRTIWSTIGKNNWIFGIKFELFDYDLKVTFTGVCLLSLDPLLTSTWQPDHNVNHLNFEFKYQWLGWKDSKPFFRLWPWRATVVCAWNNCRASLVELFHLPSRNCGMLHHGHLFLFEG